MAKQVDLKVFRTYTNVDEIKWGIGSDKHPRHHFNRFDAISKAVKELCKKDCMNHDLEKVFIGSQNLLKKSHAPPPK